ncbi:hypothetical protein [Zhongshania sp.]|uniref:DUF6841 family protein n=1 Tax=Zhongshania sp. TaxID=1971902 RepID=UPI003565BA03
MSNSEISKFIHEYCDTFRPGGSSEMPKYFHCPVTMLSGGVNLQFGCTDDLALALSSILSGLEAKGFSYSKIQELHIHRLSENTAIVSASFKRFTSDHAVLEEIAATYTIFKKTDLSWGIITIITHELDKVICKI